MKKIVFLMALAFALSTHAWAENTGAGSDSANCPSGQTWNSNESRCVSDAGSGLGSGSGSDASGAAGNMGTTGSGTGM